MSEHLMDDIATSDDDLPIDPEPLPEDDGRGNGPES